MGTEYFVKEQCHALNIKSLTQYGTSLEGVLNHYERLNVLGLKYAWYAMSRLYQHELRETTILDDEHFDLVNQSSPGLPV